MSTVDLFAGPGGWDLAARDIGVDPLGIEYDDHACATRRAAGLRTLQADVAALDPDDFAPATGLIASPPCQAWSRAGKRLGVVDQPAVFDAAAQIVAGRDGRARSWHDPRSALVLEPLRWALALRPAWLACEQVPDVLPFWRAMGDYLAEAGYDVWAGVLNAADFGVPQTRQRAILIASRDRRVVPPEPTHADPRCGLSMLAQPWVTMADALGWGFTERPSMTVCSAANGGPKGLDGGSGARRTIRRAITEGKWKVGDVDLVEAGHASRRTGSRGWVTPSGFIVCPPEDAATLQSFPDHPWQGNVSAVFQQIGNAIPPRLARAILSAVV